ncbi:MAG: hypothetical protein NVS3B25_28780 [Hymenobacter sp.]
MIYLSQATEPLPETALATLLHKARLHNQHAQLSGLLLYADQHFLQVLEGFEPELDELYARIRADPRHCHVRTLAYGLAARRAFPDWRMGYALADADALAKGTGFLPLTAAPGLAAHPSEELAQRLRRFARGRARDG